MLEEVVDTWPRDERAEDPLVVKPKAHLGDTTWEEKEAYEFTHCPCRAWCKICVEVQATDDPHHVRTNGEIRETVPRVSCDCTRLRPGMGDDGKAMVMISRDKWTRFFDRRAIAANGASDIVPIMVHDIDHVAYDEVNLKVDNERSATREKE